MDLGANTREDTIYPGGYNSTMKPLTSRISFTAAVVLMCCCLLRARAPSLPELQTGKSWLGSCSPTSALTRRNRRSWNPATS